MIHPFKQPMYPPSRSLHLCVCVCVYIHTYIRVINEAVDVTTLTHQKIKLNVVMCVVGSELLEVPWQMKIKIYPWERVCAIVFLSNGITDYKLNWAGQAKNYILVFLSFSVCLLSVHYSVGGNFAPDLTQWQHIDTRSVGFLWTRDRPVSKTCTWQHTTLTRDRLPCSQRDSNPHPSERAATDLRFRPCGHRDRRRRTTSFKTSRST